MSKSFRPRKGKAIHSARMLGIGAVIVGTLASCANQSNPEPTAIRVQNTATATLPTSTAESTQAPVASTATTPPRVAAMLPTATTASTGKFKDGEYVGDAERADRWGDLQVRATIQGGQLLKVDIVVSPHSTRRSSLISQAALPMLVSEAIQNQDANVDIVSRATDTSYAFVASLGSALSHAKP